jgi:outer membrane protein TolC
MQTLKFLTSALMVSLFSVSGIQAEPVSVGYSDALSLSTLSEKVYQQLPGKLAEGKYQRLQQANKTLSESLFAEPATASISHFNDAIGSGDGYQEWEGGVDLPLWLPGQQQAQQLLSETIIEQLPAYQAQLRLQASGEVRELIWQVKLAEAELEQARRVLDTARMLEQDVKKRVEAGDLASTEALLASTNRLEKHALMVNAESALSQQLETYQLITGEAQLPQKISEQAANEKQISPSHPQLAMQDQIIARLQAEMGLARYQDAVNPNLSFGVRRERGDDAEQFNNSLGLGISMPLNDSRYRQPAIAEASAVVADAQVERRRIERQLNKTLLARQQALRSSEQQLALIIEQDRSTQDYYQQQKKAFDLGEINLVDLMRAQVRADTTRNRKQQLEVRIKKQTAALNQALGQVL